MAHVAIKGGNNMGNRPKRKFAKNKGKTMPGGGLSKGPLLGVAGLLVLIIVLAIVIFSDKGSDDNTAMYFTRTGLSYIDVSKEKAQKISDNLITGNKLDQFDLQYMANFSSDLVQISEDAGKIFFPGDMKGFGRFALYYRELNNKKAEPVQLVANTSSYVINKDGNLVVYISDGTLYAHDLKESKEVAKGVTNFRVSEDGKQIVYVDRDGNLYLKGSEKAKKIAKNISALQYVSEDFETFYFIKDGKLYTQKVGKDAKKIASDVNEVLKVYESGAAYYVKNSATSVAAKDFVENDVKGNDTRWNELKEQTIEVPSYELFYFDGKKTESIAKNVEYTDIQVAAERPVVVYSTCNLKDVDKVKLSELNASGSIDDVLSSIQADTKQVHVAVKKKITDIEERSVVTTIIANSGKMIYYVANAKVEENDGDKEYGDLYKMSVSGSKAKKPQKYDENVYANNIGFVGDSDVFYYKNVKNVDYNPVGELYVNKKMASADVKVDTTVCYQEADDKSVFFITDWQYQKSAGTLKQYNGKETIEITKSAHGFYVTDQGEILFLSDYDVQTYSGALYLYDKKEAKKIDKDVVAIIQK